MELNLFYATNRRHEGPDRDHPTGYGTKFSDDGMENLRFGRVKVTAEQAKVDAFLNTHLPGCGIGDGENLGSYLATCAGSIAPYAEVLQRGVHEDSQPQAALGSKAMFADLKAAMEQASDVLIYIHGFNVSWKAAVGSALALQLMLRRAPTADPKQSVLVVLFSWPSDGAALPFVSYKSDRAEAAGSGGAVGRAFLKVRDFLADIRDKASTGAGQLCGQDIHLLCHSMGNFVLQNALERVADFTPGNMLPRLFEHVFLCAPDVDDTVLENGHPLSGVAQVARQVTVYHNREDKAMVVSDYTKGNPERLGGAGAARPSLLHNKIHQVDCTPVVQGVVEHSYYQNGNVNADIRASIDGWPQSDARRTRKRSPTQENVWTMVPRA